VGMLHKAGVPFLAGTDTPAGVHIFPGYSLHEELERFVAAGFTPLEALQPRRSILRTFSEWKTKPGPSKKESLPTSCYFPPTPSKIFPTHRRSRLSL